MKARDFLPEHSPVKDARLPEFNQAGPIQLWQFLLQELLLNNKMDVTSDRCIKWEGTDGQFRITKPEVLARKWGERKRKPKMNYDKMSRALRYYYDKNILTKIPGKPFTYRFHFNTLLSQVDGYPREAMQALGYYSPFTPATTLSDSLPRCSQPSPLPGYYPFSHEHLPFSYPAPTYPQFPSAILDCQSSLHHSSASGLPGTSYSSLSINTSASCYTTPSTYIPSQRPVPSHMEYYTNFVTDGKVAPSTASLPQTFSRVPPSDMYLSRDTIRRDNLLRPQPPVLHPSGIAAYL